MPSAQSYSNHTRLDPAYHLFVAPGLLANIVFSIYVTVHHWPQHRALFSWWIAMSLVLFVLGTLTRTYPLKVQDRVIRLEERLRLATLLSPQELLNSSALTERQLIALRFASDAELPALAARSLAENLQPKQIKQAITSWRPDHFRV